MKKDNLYIIEKVLRTKTDEINGKFRGYDYNFNQWIDKQNIHSCF